MKLFLFVFLGATLFAKEAVVIPHEGVREFSMNGNTLKGLATKGAGAKELEIWHSSIAVGSSTPRHVHESEEIFVILKGEILAVIGEEEVFCSAPATLICPADIPHQIFNVGAEPTDHFLVLRIDSKIHNAAGEEMNLPWRN